MARKAVEDGIHTIVASPHTLNGVYLNPPVDVNLKVADLQADLKNNQINLRLCAGADAHLCPDMSLRIENGDVGTINNTGKYVLIELPSQNIPQGVRGEVFGMKLKGITPIITHPERNSMIHRNIDVLYEFIQMGALCQVTAMSITGGFGEIVRNFTEILFRRRLIQVIASDAHSTDSRPPVLSQAVERAAEIMENYEDAESMVTRIPDAILKGNMAEFPEPIR